MFVQIRTLLDQCTFTRRIKFQGLLPRGDHFADFSTVEIVQLGLWYGDNYFQCTHFQGLWHRMLSWNFMLEFFVFPLQNTTDMYSYWWTDWSNIHERKFNHRLLWSLGKQIKDNFQAKNSWNLWYGHESWQDCILLCN